MNDILHTLEWSFPGNVDDERGHPCVVDENGLVICSVLDDGIEDDEVERNAAIIAAAPALLRALRVLYRYSPPDGSPELADALEGAAEAVNAAGFGVDLK